MSGFVNKCILVGSLGSEVESAELKDGRIACRLSLETKHTWRDEQSDEEFQRTQWHRVVVFNQNAAKFAKSFLKKGDVVYVEGRLRTNSWTDGGGVARKFTEVSVSSPGDLIVGLGRAQEPGSSKPTPPSAKQPDDILWNRRGIINIVTDVPF